VADNPLFAPAKPLMQARGYKKKGGAHVFTRPLGPGVNAWLGINARSEPGRLTLNPNVGVRHEAAQAWTTRLLDSDPKFDTAPTVQTGMSALLPEGRSYPQWRVNEGEDDENAATWELFGAEFDKYAVPWLGERSTDAGVVASLRRGEGLDTGRLSLPVLLWLTGDEAGAREALEAGRHVVFRGGLVVDYDAYADRLSAEIDAHPTGP
jgi:hypothetical protein